MARPTSQKTVVSRLFSTSERPIYLLDSGGKVVFGNQALANLLGVEVDRLPGTKCVWSGEANNLMNRLAIPPHAKDLPEYKTTISFPAREQGGQDERRTATFIALQDREEFGATLVVLGDVEADDPISDAATPFDADALHNELLKLRSQWTEPYKLDSIVGTSAAIQQVRSQIGIACQSWARVMVIGSAGSGREQIARTIHAERSSGKTALVPVSCWLIDVEPMQKLLREFVRLQKESSESLTLLLLDVDELVVEAQVTLQEAMHFSDFSWQTVATTKRSLKELAADGEFLPDLAYSLADLEIRVPSLSDRLDDIPLLAQWALETSSHAERRSGFTPDAMESLLRYAWPREVTELKEVVEEAASNATTSRITKDDLPAKLKYAEDASALPDVEPDQIKLDAFLAEVESELISRAIRQAKGNKAQAARDLGISRGKLLRRIEQLGIEDPSGEE